MIEEIKELLIKWHGLITYDTGKYFWFKDTMSNEDALVLKIDWERFRFWYRTPDEYWLAFPDLPTMKDFLVKEIAKAQ